MFELAKKSSLRKIKLVTKLFELVRHPAGKEMLELATNPAGNKQLHLVRNPTGKACSSWCSCLAGKKHCLSFQKVGLVHAA